MDPAVAEILAYVKQAVEFSKDQAPLVAQEMLTWGLTINLIGFGIGLVATALAAKFIRRGLFIERNFNHIDPSGNYIGGACFGILAFVLVPVCGFQALQVVVAPRLYLLSQIAGMLSGDK